jgi:organic hydroperoxide reductase OsmC/OhrA
MPHPFPHTYEVRLKKAGGHQQAELGAGPRPALLAGPPPQFDGDDSRWSPEHLLLASASACLLATFDAVAVKSRFAYASYESVTEGVLDKTPEGIRFTRALIRVTVRSSDPEKAARLLETAKKHCIISNSLRQPVELAVESLPV